MTLGLLQVQGNKGPRSLQDRQKSEDLCSKATHLLNRCPASFKDLFKTYFFSKT